MASINYVNYASTTHTYSSGESNPTYSHDENFTTSMYYSSGNTSQRGTSQHTATSTHIFSIPKTVVTWKYRVKNQHYATGSGALVSGYWRVEYKINSGVWQTLSGSTYSYSAGETNGGVWG